MKTRHFEQYVTIWSKLRKFVFNKIYSCLVMYSISNMVNGLDMSISLDNQHWGNNRPQYNGMV